MTDKEKLNATTNPIESWLLPSTGEDSIETSYSKALQGKGINGLISSSTTRGNIELNAITHTGTMQSNGVLITIDEEAIQDITSQTFKVFIILLDTVTSQLPRDTEITAEAIQKGRIVRLPLSKYMDACKIKDVKEARKQLNDAIKALYAVSLEWDEDEYIKPEGKSRKVQVSKHHRMRITDHTITEEEGNPIKRGVAEFRFSFDMAEYLSNAYIMPYPLALLTINTQYHPYSIPFGWKLCTLDNINITNNHPERVGNTTVQTLLIAAKGIPRYDDLMQVGKIYERIMHPFDRDLAALVEAGVLSTYWYYDEKGNRIDGTRLGSLSYTEFSRLNVHYELKDYPDQRPRLEAKSRRIKAAINRRRSAARNKANKAEDGAH